MKNGVFGWLGLRQKKVRSAFGTGRKYFSSNVFKGFVKIRDKLSRRNRDKGDDYSLVDVDDGYMIQLCHEKR